MKKSVLVFDFDGVLTNGGEELKQEAWDYLSMHWSVEYEEVLSTNRDAISGGKGSRYDILRGTFTGIGYTDEEVEIFTAAYADCYNTIVQKLLEQSGMPKWTEEILAKLAKKHMLFVNSATPEKAVRESVESFHIQQYFRGIFGQPISKVENLERAWKLARVDKEFMLFVGDGRSDAKAAKEFGCDFVGVANEWNKWRTKHDNNRPAVLIDSIAELPALLAE